MTPTPDDRLLKLTADIVSAHAASNPVPAAELDGLIRSVYTALASTTTPAAVAEVPKEPAVPIKQSVFPDHIICLEDGKKLKMLKRHLRTSYDMSVDEYRSKWGLPKSYPMVAPNYANHRSSLAKKIGLGRRRDEAAAEPIVQRVPEGPSGRRKKRPV